MVLLYISDPIADVTGSVIALSTDMKVETLQQLIDARVGKDKWVIASVPPEVAAEQDDIWVSSVESYLNEVESSADTNDGVLNLIW